MSREEKTEQLRAQLFSKELMRAVLRISTPALLSIDRNLERDVELQRLITALEAETIIAAKRLLKAEDPAPRSCLVVE